MGLVAHNLLSLPLSPLAIETAGPVLIYGALFVWCVTSRGNEAARRSLAGWALLNLIGGGILTVLPLPFLPFTPEQTLAHYGAHLIYSLAQVPLLLLLVRRRQMAAAKV